MELWLAIRGSTYRLLVVLLMLLLVIGLCYLFVRLTNTVPFMPNLNDSGGNRMWIPAAIAVGWLVMMCVIIYVVRD